MMFTWANAYTKHSTGVDIHSDDYTEHHCLLKGTIHNTDEGGEYELYLSHVNYITEVFL